MAYETIEVRIEADKVGVITLNRPKQLNALNDQLMNELGASSKLRPRPGLLTRLKAAGRVAAEGWLKDHAGAVGRESSVDLRALFG